MLIEHDETVVSADRPRCTMEDASKTFTVADKNMHAEEYLEFLERDAIQKMQQVEAGGDFKIDKKATSLRTQKLNRLEQEYLELLEASKFKIKKSLQSLVEQEINLKKKVSFTTQEFQRLDLFEASKVTLENFLQELVEKQANLELKASFRTYDLRLEELVASKFEFEKDAQALIVKQENLEIEASFLSLRDEAVTRKECEVKKRVEKLLVFQEKLANKVSDGLHVIGKEIESEEALIQKENEEINNRKIDHLQRSLDVLENEKQQICHTEEKVEAMKTETSELFVLKLKLKEEIETARPQKQELEVEPDEIKEFMVKFEIEWQSIIEKGIELQMEEECNDKEREVLEKILKDERNSLKLLKNERNSLKILKDALQDQYKRDNKSLSRDREALTITMELEHSEWFSKIQEERLGFLFGIEVENMDLEDRLANKCEEMESYLAKRERALKEEKKKEFLRIYSLWETLARETEEANLELTKLDTERREINLDRERRLTEWSELKKLIEELKVQTQSLRKQMELLHASREKILVQIEHLKQLEDYAIGFDYLLITH